MRPSTALLLPLLRYAFLLLSITGALALCFYLADILVLNPPPGQVVSIGVRHLPAGLARQPAPEPRPTATEAAVAAGGPAQLLPRGEAGLLVYREANPATRLVLRLVSSRPQSVPYVLATLLFCLLVYRILRDIRPGVPFSAANVRRLRALGGLLIACDVYHWTLSWWLARHLAAVAPAGRPALEPVSAFGTSLVANWLIGLMLLIVAAGYQRGVELSEDAELTV